MVLTLKEITYLYERLTSLDRQISREFSKDEKKQLKRKFEIEIDYLNSLKSATKEKLIFKFVEEKFGIDKDNLLKANRKQDLCDIRRAISVILHEDYSFHKCGEIMRRNHSTITHQCLKHEELYGRDKRYTRVFDIIKNYRAI